MPLQVKEFSPFERLQLEHGCRPQSDVSILITSALPVKQKCVVQLIKQVHVGDVAYDANFAIGDVLDNIS